MNIISFNLNAVEIILNAVREIKRRLRVIDSDNGQSKEPITQRISLALWMHHDLNDTVLILILVISKKRTFRMHFLG